MYFSSTMVLAYVLIGLAAGACVIVAGGTLGYMRHQEHKTDGLGFVGMMLFITLALLSLFPILGKSHQTITYNQYQQMTTASDEVFVDTAKDIIWLKDGDRLLTVKYPAAVEKTASLLPAYDGRYHQLMSQNQLVLLLLGAMFSLCIIPFIITSAVIRNINKKAWSAVPGANIFAQDSNQAVPRFRIIE